MGEYDRTVKAIYKFFNALKKDGLSDIASKGGIGEVLLANALGHTVKTGDKGADGQDSEGKLYEYKVSWSNQFNFRFGARPNTFVKGRKCPKTQKMVKKHFEGAICALREEGSGKITKVYYCPTKKLVKSLLEHFKDNSPKQVIKNYRWQDFEDSPDWEDWLDKIKQL